MQENKLEKKFEKFVVKKEFVNKIEVSSPDTIGKDTMKYYIGYDDKNRVVNDANSEFFEYDSWGRISKRYACNLDRDPQCNKPYIFFYEYSDGKLSTIKLLNSFGNDSIPHNFETFEYDQQHRLIKHTKLPTDTFIYSYSGNDTLKQTELWTYWVNSADNKQVKVSRTTTFQYDNSGNKISSTWIMDDNMSMRNEFYYDSKNRIIMQRDTSLDNFVVREPNSCCILYWTEYKYDEHDRIVEEIHSVGTNDNPAKQFQRKIIFQY